MEVFALNWLEKTREAAERVEAFLSSPQLREAADSNRVGRMLNWKAHLHAERGEMLDGVLAYQQARPYAGRLSRDTRQDLILNGAYFYWRTGKLQDGLSAAKRVENELRDRAEQTAGLDSLSGEDRSKLLRSLRQQALLHLKAGNPRRAVDYARQSTLFATGSRLDVARITLARAQANLRRLTAASKTFRQAEDSLSRGSNELRRPRLLLHFRRGQFRLRADRPHAALRDLKKAKAIADSSGAREFEAQVLLALGKAHRAVDARRRALAVFEEAGRLKVNRGNQAAVQARRKAQLAALSLQDSGWLAGTLPGWALTLFGLLLAMGVGGGLALQIRERAARRPAPAAQDDGDSEKGGRSGPETLPGDLHTLSPSDPSSNGPAPDLAGGEETPSTGSEGRSANSSSARGIRGGDSEGSPPRRGEASAGEGALKDGSVGDGSARGGSVGSGSAGDGATGEGATGDGDGAPSDRHRFPRQGFDERGERLLRLCEHYVQLWKDPPSGLPPGRRDDLLKKVPHLIFQATLEWLYGRDVWQWLRRGGQEPKA
jgi:tetratricopeptide (TPR) repeat protein